MTYLLVLLLTAVAWGLGGYAAWATLVLELGAAALLSWTLIEETLRESPEDRKRRLARKGLPFLYRHPCLARAIGRSPAEIAGAEPPRRSGLALPLALLTVWIALSLLPLPAAGLGALSPEAFRLRSEVEALVPRAGFGVKGAPLTLTPLLTAEGLWVWLALLALFRVSVRLSEKAENVEKLTTLLLVLGAGFGVYGIGQWLSGLQAVGTTGVRATSIWTSASFGNRNHYAAFLSMLLLPSLGGLGYRWLELRASGHVVFKRATTARQEAGARLILAGLGVGLMSLGLLFSLSRSGITFALAACGVLAFLCRRHETKERDAVVLEASRKTAVAPLLALGLAVTAFAVWMGLDPVMERFHLLPDEWQAERGRWPVWVDSSRAAADYWRTGSGLSTFRYVFPIYRTFGGSVLYSWAHNDYLQLVIELGLPGAVLVVWLMAVAASRAARIQRRCRGTRGTLHAGYCAALVAIALHSFTDFGLHLPANAALASVLLGVTVGFSPARPR